MHPIRSAFLLILVPSFCLLLLAPGAAAQQGKPSLAAEIQDVLESDGAEAATRRFNDVFPSKKDEYDVDQKAFGEMAAELMKGGDYQAGQAVIQMISAITQESLAGIEMEAPAPRRQREERKENKEKPEKPEWRGPDRGPARTDLSRFTGVYGTQENVDDGRTLFVAETCDGHLVSGAMWGDASNWWLSTVGDNVFEVKSDFSSVRMEFEMDADGKATAMKHDLDFMANPLPRVGPLPEKWEDCVSLRRG